jgi:hypothetical protein
MHCAGKEKDSLETPKDLRRFLQPLYHTIQTLNWRDIDFTPPLLKSKKELDTII